MRKFIASSVRSHSASPCRRVRPISSSESSLPILCAARAVSSNSSASKNLPHWSYSNVNPNQTRSWTSRSSTSFQSEQAQGNKTGSGSTAHSTSAGDLQTHFYREGQLSSFYNQSAIDAVASKKSVRITPTNLLYMARSPDSSHILRSAQYLQKELPVRVAHRIDGFRHLPFIIGCNPTIRCVHELYIRAFQMLTDFPKITDLDNEERYTEMLRALLDDHKDVVTQLAEGFKECQHHIKDPELVASFLDRTLTSRLGIRMLCEHHIALREPRPDHTGVICIRTSLKDVVEQCADHVKKTCTHHYGRAPGVVVQGNLSECVFPYISMQEAIGPLEYMIIEVLKNAMRATVETNGLMADLPPVAVSLASNDIDFLVRISDQGGGIKHQHVPHVFNYHFTTAASAHETSPVPADDDPFGDMNQAMNEGRGPMFGYGFGLSISRAYAEYLGGTLTFETMQGLGTDIYLRLRHIDGKYESFRI